MREAEGEETGTDGRSWERVRAGCRERAWGTGEGGGREGARGTLQLQLTQPCESGLADESMEGWLHAWSKQGATLGFL